MSLENLEERVVPNVYTVTNTQDSGPGSLRYGLSTGDSVIDFNIPTSDTNYNPATGVYTISPASGLPNIGTNGLLIDGTPQPGYTAAGHPVIDLNGASAGANANGFGVAATSVAIQGLAINGFSAYGIAAWGNSDVIKGNYIGTDATGTKADGNQSGIIIYAGAVDDTVGGTTAGAGNLISGNSDKGIWVSDAATTGTVVAGNFVGTNAAGTAAIPNGNWGVLVSNGTAGNTIGGTTAGAGNLISGNTNAGLQFDGAGTSNNVLEYNLIGVNAANTAAIANGIDIVTSRGAANNHILNNTQLSSGSWTEYSSTNSNGFGTMLLLPNGDIMVQEGYDPSTGQAVTNAWDEITPDALGSYLDGTFSSLAPMSLQRLYFGSVVLPDDDVMVYGGEYSGASGNNNEVNSGEMYDPATNTWTSIASIPSSLDPQNDFGDEALEVLPDGDVLGGDENAAYAYIYDPSTNTWSKGPSKTNGDTYGEEAWAKLPGASADIVDYEIWASMGASPGYADYLNTTSMTWVATGSVPVALSEDSEGELGPALLMPNGLLLQVGANGVTDPPTNTALYNPSTNTWTAGPTLPDNLTSDDAPGATLPDGNVIFAADSSNSANKYSGPTSLFEYNPTTKSLSEMTLPSALVNDLGNDPSYYGRMLALPTGQIAFEDGDGNIWFYQESESVNPAWAPTISSMVNNGGGVYTLTGTQLNGMDEGAEYGDDAQMASNYPIVQLTGGSGDVYDATSSNWSSVGVATGNTPVTTQFTLPAGLPVGQYMLDVDAVGISSSPVSVYYNGSTLSWVPVVSAVSPNEGPLSGGATITITGSNLTGATVVDFGTTAATSFTVISSTEITATVPAHTAGTVDVTVSNGISTSGTSSADQYTYVPQPVVSGLSPISGSMFGGETVTIAGSYFTGASAVDFGSVAAASFTVVSSAQINAVAPSEAAGTVDVTVTTAGGTSAKNSNDKFTDVPVPLVTAVSPDGGPLAGGTTVTITGQNFTGVSSVDFGSLAATSFTVVSATEITATDPAESAGTVDVTVTTSDGTSSTSPADEFFYVTAPAVTGVGPDAGPLAGGQTITITGTALTASTAVEFGSVAATSFTVVSETEITAVTPAESAGAVDITVTNPGGTSSTSSADQYTFVVPPDATGISPTAGPVAGGQVVTITGTGFTNATAVDFETVAAASFTVLNDTEITAVTPAVATGSVGVTVITAGGTSAAVTYTFAPVPVVSAVAPAIGPAYGGQTVTITGTGFTNATAVAFGSVAAASFTVVSDTEITAVDPAEGGGTTDLTVTTAGGTSATSGTDQYTYVPDPAVSGLSSTAGPLAGGQAITISGTNFTNATGVGFGGTAATSFTFVNNTEITATAPAGTAGTVDVTVTTQYSGTSATSSADQYTYVAVPAVTALGPTDGPTAGGQTVTITGTALTGATAVDFGSVAAVSFTVLSATELAVFTPAEATGQVNVTVTTPGGRSLTSAADLYTYVPAPVIQFISITQGSSAGGATVTLTGSNLGNASAVDFGSVPATIVSDNGLQIVVTTPAEPGGTVPVTAVTAGGTASAPSEFTFVAVPSVTGLSQAAGPLTGGTTVTISGSGFTGASAVDFGTAAAISFMVVSDTDATAVAPAETAGTVDVTVTVPVGGMSPTGPADQYTFTRVPVVSGVSPSTGPLAGGTNVTISGSYLANATAVDFGTTATSSFTVNANGTVTAVAPGGTAGTVDVTVVTPGGTSATSSADRFTTNKAAPTFTGLISPTITFGTVSTTITGTLSANAGSFSIPVGETIQVTLNGVTQMANLTSGDTFSTVFTTAALIPTNYVLNFSYGGDANYNSTSSNNASLTVTPAVPDFSGLSSPTITYGTASVGVSGTLAPAGGPFIQAGETVQVTLDGITQSATLGATGAFSTTFATATLGTGASPYTIDFVYAGDGNFASASGSSSLTVTQATPVFSGLSAPVITPGTASATISGTLGTGTLGVPAGETVAITLDGTTEDAMLGAGGSFGATFNTAGLDTTGSPYAVTLSYAGDANFGAASGDTSVTVIPVDPAASTVSVSASSVASGSGITVTVHAIDAAGNAFTTGGLTVAFGLSGGVGQGTFSQVTDNGNGTYTAAFTGTIAGSNTITATINGQAVGNTEGVTVTPGTADAATSTTTLSASTDAAGTEVTVTVTVRDAAGNPLVTGGLPVSLTLGSLSGGQGSFGSVIDHHNGTYTTTFTGSIAGDNTVVALIGGNPVPAASISVTPGQVSLSNSTLALAAGAVQFGGSTTVTLTAVDDYGNPDTTGGLAVVFALTGTGTLGPVVDHEDGTYTATVTGSADGDLLLAATIGGQPLDQTGPSLMVVGNAVSPAKSTLKLLTSTVSAGGTTTVTLQAEDAKGRPETAGGLEVVFELTSKKGGQGAFTPAIDNGNGTYTATFQGTLSGSNTIAATIAEAKGSPKAATVKVTPGTWDAATSRVTASAATVKAGGKVTVTLQPEDAYGNKVTAKGLTLAFGIGSQTLVGKYQSNGSYTAVYNATIAGSFPVTATIDGQAVTSALPTITVTAGAASPKTSVVSLSADTVAVGGAITIMLQAEDAYGNDETTGGLKVAFKLGSKAGGQGTFGTVTDNHNGTYTVTFNATAPGSNTIEAMIGGAKVTSMPALTVT